MDRYWLLAWTTYGTWLPGDQRGFVGPVWDEAQNQVIHNARGDTYDTDKPALRRYAQTIMKGAPVFLRRDQANEVFEQLHETASHRGWRLSAVAIMRNHIHVVVGVIGDPDPSSMLRDFKSYASRRLNRRWTKPQSGTWWTESGSKRKLADENLLNGAIRYVREQQHPLVVWIRGDVDG